ncbi:MAG TPA: hypothetical protein PKK66_02600 [Bacteroidales bacterium]|nr:hypothetical protein [Bacteroidales bacterium]
MSSRKLLLLLCLYIVSQHFTFSQVDSLILQKFANVPSVGEVFVLGQYENNCASASFLNKSYVSASFQNRFLLKELENEAVSGILRFHQNAFIFQVSHFGYAKYGDLTVAGAYARSFGKHIAIAARFYYSLLHAAEYPSVHSVTFDVSLYAPIHDRVGIGFSVYNPARLKYGIVGKTMMPLRFYFNIDYRISKNLLIYSQVEKELKSRLGVGVGAVFRINKLFLTSYVQFPAPKLSIDAELWWRHFLFGFGCEYQLAVGFIPKITLHYSFESRLK